MKMARPMTAVLIVAAVCGLAQTSRVEATIIPVSYTTTYNGASTVTTPAYPSGTVTVVPNSPSSYTYGDTFTGATALIPGTGSPGYGFYDDILFTISGSTIDSVSTTINLGSLQISNLQERLFALNGNTIPTLGPPAGGAIDAWTSPIGTSGMVAVLSPTSLAAGTYVLEIRGTATGSGGSYAGVLNVTPVPLPATLSLLIIGAGLVGGLASTSRKPRGALNPA
jgi:hypothetical protein